MKTFTVPEVPGSKRTSGRIYTHAIIGSFNYEAAIARLNKEKPSITRQAIKDWNYESKRSTMNVGDLIYVTDCLTPWSYPAKPEYIDNGKAFIAMYPAAADYAENVFNSRMEQLVADSKVKVVGVLQWSMSFANASKGLGRFWHCKDLRVVEVIEVIKPKK